MNPQLKQAALIGAFFLPVFFGVGVGLNYLFGALENDPAPPSTPPSSSPPAAEPPPRQGGPASYPEGSKAEREKAKKVALQFMPPYLEPKPEEKELNSFLKSDAVQLGMDSLQRKIWEETEHQPAGMKVLEIEALPVDELDARRQGRVDWNIWATLQTGNGGKYDLAYHVT